jgi:methyl-accepting chemotaxis protein
MSRLLQAIRQPRLAVRLQFIVVTALLCLLTLGGISIYHGYNQMWDDRAAKLRSMDEVAVSLAVELERRVQAGALTQEQAIEQFRNTIRPIRFDGGSGYYFAYAMDGRTLVLGPTPSVEGTNRINITDANSEPFIQRQIAAAQRGGGTNVYYYPKPGEKIAQPKLAYVVPFKPWNLYVGTGAYVDDLRAAALASAEQLVGVIAVLLGITVTVAWLVSRGITRPLGRLRQSMTALADGNLTGVIAGGERRDEMGDMARAVVVFQQHMAKGNASAAEQAAEREQAAQEKRAALVGMADTIEQETSQALQQISATTTMMTTTANEMSNAATRTGTSAQNAATAASQALANAQTVASAAEQLSVSIREIGGQVGQSSAVVARAVEAGRETRSTIEALNEKVGRIGAVADIIGEIAARTNLLALNATIEAARAGDAGKGFAVVASEVKQLATQTAKSTEEITRHIAEVKAATGESVTSVVLIEQTITEINAIAGSIAAAVEQQGAATAEIARNITETASAANEMTQRTHEVSHEAEQTGTQAGTVLTNITELREAVLRLQHAVVRAVRTSTTDVDRRMAPRYATDLACRVTASGAGTSDARLVELSAAGARIIGGPTMAATATGTLAIDGVSRPLAFVSRSTDDGGSTHLAFQRVDQAAEVLAPLLRRLADRLAA